ncbi:hypothetical protein FB451DRAFT_1355434 [Mycena latifolia]|nr:hypothetical protein FB451DRAFT_1355434 [Mycena latifolia]
MHMSAYDFQVLDTLESADCLKGELADLNIPPHMVPRTLMILILPSQAHPSYPYGNPTNVEHPASRPCPPYDPSSRHGALFEDMGYDGGGVNEKEEEKRAIEARKMASGASNATASQAGMGQDQTAEEDEEDENDENENDEEEEESEGVTEESQGTEIPEASPAAHLYRPLYTSS